MIPPETDSSAVLKSLPDGLRKALFDSLNEIVRNFRERRWEPSELNGGKLCEVAYTILKGHIDGRYPAAPAKPNNMVDACRALEHANVSFTRSARIQIPRVLMALYEIRNNRGVGHAGGDVDPNHMDAVAVLYMAKWVVAEIVRLFHGVSTAEASLIVDALVERTLPLIWEIEGKQRVLNPKLTAKEKTLVLLYHLSTSVAERDLVSWIEHSNPSVYRRDVLRKLHGQRMIEYDATACTVAISPTGIRYVEENINLEVKG